MDGLKFRASTTLYGRLAEKKGNSYPNPGFRHEHRSGWREMSYLDFLAGWWSGWVVDRDSRARLELRVGPKLGHNDAASLAAESGTRLGAFTVWEGGEIEVEVMDIESEQRIHVFSGLLGGPQDLDAQLTRYIRACEG